MYFGGYKKSDVYEQIMSAWLALAIILMPMTPVYAEEGGDTSGDAPVSTGDASASVDAQTVANTNTIETVPESEPEPEQVLEEEAPAEEEEVPEEAPVKEQAEDGEASVTPALVVSENEEESDVDLSAQTGTASSTASTTIHTNINLDNDADIDTVATAGAQTGDNTASSTGETTIDTGNATADINILNIANTNVIDSYGFMLLLNSLFGDVGTIDFRQFIAPLMIGQGTTGGSCDTGVCGGDDSLNVNITSTSTINNSVIVRSQTGGNSATGDNVDINTGDASAGANIVNIANTNIVDSNYMLLALNNFGDWSGDLVLPGKDFFMSMLYGMGTTGASTVTVDTDNNANISNDVSTIADTGSNTASTTEDGVITTGDALANTTVTNVVNQNFFNTDSLYILFRVHGTWTGNVFGLPPGLSWRQTPLGVEVFGDPDASVDPSAIGDGLSNLSVHTQNNADIKNNVELYALTGENQVQGGTGSINTGNAQAGANIVNMVNSNIIGRNWILAIVNIFGDWNGNLSFGRPDLWVGGKIEPVNPMQPIMPGSALNFKVVVVNRGDSDATNVVLNNYFDIPFISFLNTSNPEQVDLRNTQWNLGTIPAGGHAEFTLPAVVNKNIVSGTTNVQSTVTVDSFETDADDGDNTEYMSVAIDNYGGNLSPVSKDDGKLDTSRLLPEFTIVKTSSTKMTVSSSTVDYTVTLKNVGGYSPDAVVRDVLTDEDGDLISQQVWELGPVYDNEEITITYSTIFTEDMDPGEYTNTAEVVGKTRTDSDDVVRVSAQAFVTLELPSVPTISPTTPVMSVTVDNEEVKQVDVDTIEVEEVYGITLMPPMCTAYGCILGAEDDYDSMLLANALGSGFDPENRSLKLFVLAAVMYAVGRPKDGRKGMSLFF